MESKTEVGPLWTSNGFDGIAGQLPVHPPYPLSRWTEFHAKVPVSAPQMPGSRGSHRFGSLSYNQFFSRHNPHPFRVTHLKGLLDVPICVVNDDGYFANPRYALQFPPNEYNIAKTKFWEAGSRKKAPGTGLITPNSSRLVTGLQAKNQKKKSYVNHGVCREGALSHNGIEAWRDELKMLTDALMKSSDDYNSSPGHQKTTTPQTDGLMKKRTTQYSAETGRIIPSSSLSRGRVNSRRQKMRSSDRLEHIIEQSSSEVLVLQLLCQVLQTDDITEVQKWLVAAPERERAFAFELLKVALSASEVDQSGFRPVLPSFLEHEEEQVHSDDLLPTVSSEQDSVNKVNRLVIDHEEKKNDSNAEVAKEQKNIEGQKKESNEAAYGVDKTPQKTTECELSKNPKTFPGNVNKGKQAEVGCIEPRGKEGSRSNQPAMEKNGVERNLDGQKPKRNKDSVPSFSLQRSHTII